MARMCRLLVAAILLFSPRAPAEAESAGVVAEALFQRAREEMRRGDYDSACRTLTESHRLDSAPGTLLNLALCKERVGKLASAWAHARALADSLPPDDERKPIAENMVASLAERVPHIRIIPSPEGEARVELDGVELRASSLGVLLPVDAGEHVIVVTAPGQPDRVKRFAIEPRDTLELHLDLTSPAPDPPSASIHEATAQAPPRGGHPSRSSASASENTAEAQSGDPRLLGWSAAAVGVLGLALGTVAGVMLLNKKAKVDEACPPPDRVCADASDVRAASDGQTLLVWTLASLSAGAVGTGVGAYLLLQPRAATSSDSMPRTLGTSTGAMLTWTHAF